jgi:GT2 family glycosyltransferase
MEPLLFFADDSHALLVDAGLVSPVSHIGPDGRNLTITFLSCNRPSLSIRLIQSIIREIPQYAGRLLITDNGSDPDEFTKLEHFVTTKCTFPTRIIKLASNYGVARARNLAFAQVQTDWMLSLDNDIYLVGNPFPQIARDLRILGCHFLNVPLINPDGETFYSFGGHLTATVKDDRILLRIESMLPRGAKLAEASKITSSENGFLCSFLFGGASVINRHTFMNLRGFDAEMFVGFEDLEFSLRLLRRGYKVGSSGVTHFVHDHCRAATAADRKYESIRYSRELLRQSARHFELTHGIAVWDDQVEAWLGAQREKQDLPIG